VQSVYAADGNWHHEPLRLHAVLEAPTHRIDRVLQTRQAVRELVDNGWIKLFALDPESAQCRRYVAGGGWEAAST
jgi:uncharacterized protein YbcC (UPF0753/DUF2309 family)